LLYYKRLYSCEKSDYKSHNRVPARENTHHVQPTTGRFSDLRLTSRLLPIRQMSEDRCLISDFCLRSSDFWTVDKTSLGLPTQEPEQALTAARPSRISTAFPFKNIPEHTTPGPVIGLSSYQRAKNIIIKQPSKGQAKNANFYKYLKGKRNVGADNRPSMTVFYIHTLTHEVA
jgi:hypothetical protein